MQQSITSLRAELRRNQDKTVEKAAKKARLSSEITFRRKGNKKQYRFNEVVQDKFSSAAIRIDEAATSAAASTSSGSLASTLSTALRSSSAGVLSALKQAREAVEEGTEVVKNRQKAIRIADRSELGWTVINEYGDGKPLMKLSLRWRFRFKVT